MKVTLDDLRRQPRQRMLIGFKESLSGLPAVKPVVGDLTISLGSWGVHLGGRLTTLLKLSCDRCLKSYFQSLSVEVDERLVHESKPAAESREKELLKDDFVEEIPPDGMLDISDIVYQAIILATPSHCLCSTDCPGYPLKPTSAGKPFAEDNEQPTNREDPRWKNLKTLFANDESGENR